MTATLKRLTSYLVMMCWLEVLTGLLPRAPAPTRSSLQYQSPKNAADLAKPTIQTLYPEHMLYLDI